jgi:hypothetical protein
VGFATIYLAQADEKCFIGIFSEFKPLLYSLLFSYKSCIALFCVGFGHLDMVFLAL